MNMDNRNIPLQLALQYARCADDRDFEGMRDIITPDFTQQGTDWRCEGADAFVAQLDVLREQFSATLHMVGNQLGEWSDGNYIGETYCVAHHICEREGVGRKIEMGIRYRDIIVPCDGDYRYASRDLRVVWVSDQPLLG